MSPSRSLRRLVSIICVTCAAMALRSISSCFFWFSSRARSSFSACACWTSNWASATLAGAPRLVFCFRLLYWLCLTCCALFLSTRPLFLSCSNNEFPMGCTPTVNANLKRNYAPMPAACSALNQTHDGDLGFTGIGQAEVALTVFMHNTAYPHQLASPSCAKQRLSSPDSEWAHHGRSNPISLIFSERPTVPHRISGSRSAESRRLRRALRRQDPRE